MLDQDTMSAKTVNGFKSRNGTKKKDGPVSGLKSAGPRGRFQSFGAAGPVSYPTVGTNGEPKTQQATRWEWSKARV